MVWFGLLVINHNHVVGLAPSPGVVVLLPGREEDGRKRGGGAFGHGCFGRVDNIYTCINSVPHKDARDQSGAGSGFVGTVLLAIAARTLWHLARARGAAASGPRRGMVVRGGLVGQVVLSAVGLGRAHLGDACVGAAACTAGFTSFAFGPTRVVVRQVSWGG